MDTNRPHYNIVFSIPIHEKLEVVIDQILNILFYNPGCGIVYHVSQKFDFEHSQISFNDFEKFINEVGNVWVNSSRLRTGRFDIIQTHMSNYKYVSDLAEFDYFAICASNELFIKKGLFDSLNGIDALVQNIRLIDKTDWFHTESVYKDVDFLQYVKNHNSDVFFSHIEGQIYKPNIFEKLVEAIESFYDYKQMTYPYPREEIYFPTVLNTICFDVKLKLSDSIFTYVPWYRKHGLIDTRIYEIERLRNQNDSCYYSVKRVTCNINDNVRGYIRATSDYFIKEQRILPYSKDRPLFLYRIVEFLTILKRFVCNIILDVRVLLLKRV